MGAARILRTIRPRHVLIASAAAFTGFYGAGRQNAVVKQDGPDFPPHTRNTSPIDYSQRVGNWTAIKYAQSHEKRGDAELINQENDSDSDPPGFEHEDESSWALFSRKFNDVTSGLSNTDWAGVGDTITDYIVPAWARAIPDAIQKLQLELSMKPGSLADDVWQEAHDAYSNPEILWDAQVRVGNSLGVDELEFRQKRKSRLRSSLAKYLEIKEDDIHEDDVPVIGICGSGGGLRALVAGTSSYLSAQKAGLFDCAMYTAGVSGSCWLQMLYFSSLGKQNHQTLLNHLKSRIGTHIAFPPAALKLATNAPTNKFILSGFIEKLKGDPNASFGLVDVYSGLLTARLMVPKGDLGVCDRDLKLSNQRTFLENGEHPMPIYTLVRHEIPVEEELRQSGDSAEAEQKAREKAKKEAWFQWIELQPWEVWCEEFGAGIPTWGLGRPFKDGRNSLLDSGVALPEIRQSLLMGIYGSAFCATLAHYYKEIKPLLAGHEVFRGLDDLLQGKNDDLMKIHPIDAATVPNFVYGMDSALKETCPASVLKADHLELMDAGMSNNLPIFPLLRPGRDVDILIAFDASAEVQKENWLSAVDGYAKQRGVKAWPVGTGWPKEAKPAENVDSLGSSVTRSSQEANTNISEARQEPILPAPVVDEIASTAQQQSVDQPTTNGGLGPCTIWVGTKHERDSGSETPPSKQLSWEDEKDSTFRLMQPDASLTLIYFPLLPNKSVPGVDPDKTEFLSTWNFIYTPEQVDQVAALAKANFDEGADATKRTVRAVYERKKKVRLEREERYRFKTWRNKVTEYGDHFIG